MRTLYCHLLDSRWPLTRNFSFCVFCFLFCRFLQTFPHIWCLKDAVDRTRMQHCGHSICHFRPMVMMMATMGKRKLAKHTKVMSRKHTQKMTMVIQLGECESKAKWWNQERLLSLFLGCRWCRSRPTVSRLLQRCQRQQSFGVWHKFAGFVAVFETGSKGWNATGCSATGPKCGHATLCTLPHLPKRV